MERVIPDGEGGSLTTIWVFFESIMRSSMDMKVFKGFVLNSLQKSEGFMFGAMRDKTWNDDSINHLLRTPASFKHVRPNKNTLYKCEVDVDGDKSVVQYDKNDFDQDWESKLHHSITERLLFNIWPHATRDDAFRTLATKIMGVSLASTHSSQHLLPSYECQFLVKIDESAKKLALDFYEATPSTQFLREQPPTRREYNTGMDMLNSVPSVAAMITNFNGRLRWYEGKYCGPSKGSSSDTDDSRPLHWRNHDESIRIQEVTLFGKFMSSRVFRMSFALDQIAGIRLHVPDSDKLSCLAIALAAPLGDSAFACREVREMITQLNFHNFKPCADWTENREASDATYIYIFGDWKELTIVCSALAATDSRIAAMLAGAVTTPRPIDVYALTSFADGDNTSLNKLAGSWKFGGHFLFPPGVTAINIKPLFSHVNYLKSLGDVAKAVRVDHVWETSTPALNAPLPVPSKTLWTGIPGFNEMEWWDSFICGAWLRSRTYELVEDMDPCDARFTDAEFRSAFWAMIVLLSSAASNVASSETLRFANSIASIVIGRDGRIRDYDSFPKKFKNSPTCLSRCENPDCDNSMQPQSLQHCNGCKKVAYCGTKCQKKRWKHHKLFCKAK